MALFVLKCFLNSSSEIVGGRPLMKIREDAIFVRRSRHFKFNNSFGLRFGIRSNGRKKESQKFNAKIRALIWI
jgi:hypothetical protein